MFVVEVTPLRKGSQIDTLSYYSGTAYPRGTIVEVPLRNSIILGVVTDSEEVGTAKTALRAATFTLKKLPHQENTKALSPALIVAALEIAEWYATSLSSILYNLLSPEIRSGEIKLLHTHHIDAEETHVPEILQGTKQERFVQYRSLVRETFAHGGSIHIVTPTSIEAEEIKKTISQGIEDRTIVLTSTMQKRARGKAYKELEDYSKPKLIITSTAHSILERHDITTMIVEHERSPHFTARVRPYLDYRFVYKIFAKHTGRRIIFGDLLPRSEEEQLRRDEIFRTLAETPKRLELPGKLEVVNMKDEHNATNVFNLFSPKVLENIKATKKAKGRTFLFAARRGLAPVVACVDCGYIFRSPNTGAPYSLIRIKKGDTEERWFVCSSSGARERAPDTCPKCASWRLRERGIGIQSVYDELLKEIKNVPVILFDHTTANTYKKAIFLRDKFYNTKGALMLGTQMAIPYLTKPVTSSVVVNMDALYATPTWRLQEDNLETLLRLREVTEESLFIQTRSKSDSLLERAKRGQVEKFYDEELELRKTFNYPPFTTFIHLTWQDKPEKVSATENFIKKMFEKFEHTVYSAPPSPKGLLTRYCLIRIASKDWPDRQLGKALRALPPSVRITFNPDRIV